MPSHVPKSGLDRSKIDLALMTAVLLMAFAFGANGLNTDPIWTDELYSITNMGGFDPPFGPEEIVRSVADNFPDHVPLFFLMGAAWANFVGWTQFALRLMPVLAGVLMIAWMYRLGSDMFGRFTGKLAAILLGTSAYMILYIHDFRMYSLFLMLATLHLWLYWRLAFGRDTDRVTVAMFVVSTAAILFTHFFSFIFFAGLGLFHLVFVAKSRRWWQILIGWCVAALLFIPYLPVLVAGVTSAASKGNVTRRAASASDLFMTFLDLFGNGSWLVLLLLTAISVFVLLRHRPSLLIKFLMIPVTILVSIILLNEVVGIIPLTRMRYFLIVWIPLILVIAASMQLVPKRRTVAAIVLLVWIVSGFQFYRSKEILTLVGSMFQTRRYPPMQDYVFHLRGKVRPEDYVLGFTDYNYVNQVLTLGNSVSDYYLELQLGIDGGFIPRGAYGEWLQESIRLRFDEQPYLLFTYNPQNLARSHDQVLQAILADYVACETLVDLPHLYVQRYVDAMLECDREYAPIIYDNGVSIVDRFARYLPESDMVQVLTGWEVENEELLYEYNVSLQIISPESRNVRQVDSHLYSDILKWYREELPTADLPPGDYHVMVIVYDRDSTKKVTGTDLRNGRSDGIFPILTFTVGA